MNTEKQLQLVSFEQAKRLKALGFDWETENYYRIFEPKTKTLSWNLDNHNKKMPFGNEYASAPTVALALKWMRDVGGFDYSIHKGDFSFEYSYTLLNGRRGRQRIKGYEAAESALLDEVLTLLEKAK